MGQKATAGKQPKKTETNDLIVPSNEVNEYMRSITDPIARRAYELFEIRGYAHGNDWEDWYKAESELLQPVNIELSDSGDALLAIANVSGYRAEDLKVGVESQSLQICGRSSGQKQHSNSGEESRHFEGFVASFDLPASIDTSQVSADIRRDLLEIRLPKARQTAVET
jgi:HSP20 family molecular chaperone IbpA